MEARTPPRPKAVEVEVPVEAVVGVEVEAPKKTLTPPITPQNQPPKLMQNDQLCPVGGRLRAFAHLWPLITSDQFVLQTVTKGYRIEFTGNPPRTKEPRCTPIPRNQARRQDLERGLESMLEKRAIREIPFHADIPGFYSPIFLVAKESGGWRPILNLKAFNKFVKPLSFRMETLRTVMDCLGEAHQQRLKTSEHLRDSSMSETWAVSIDLRDAYFHVPVAPEHTRFLRFAYDGAPVRALNSTSGVHEDCANHRGVPQDTGCRHAPVSRRLASKEPVKVACGTSTRPHTVLGDKTGLPRKRRKVPVDTHTVPSIPGIDPRPHQYARFPEREEGHQSVATGILAPSTEPSASENLAEALRTSVQSARVSPHGGDTYSSDPTYAPQSVDAGLGQPISPDIPRPRIAQRAGVVGIAGQPDGGPAVSQARSDYDDSHGCLDGGLGRSPRRLGDLRSVAAGLGQAPHQLARTAGSMADSAAFSASGTGHCCGCPYGQYHYSGLHQQGGWNSVPHLVLPGTGPVGLVQATRDLPGCQPHIGSQERPGGRPVQGETQPPHGVVPPQDSGSAHIRALADSPCGSLRVREEPQTSSVLLSAPLSDVERNKRSDAELGESVRVLVPADQPHPEGIEETEAAVVSPDPPSSPVLAQPAVVPSADQHADRPSASDHTQGQPPEELGHGDVLPQTGQNETGCMAAVRKSFVDRGFSQGVAETAARARRESTCRLYDSRLLHYRRWCVERGVGPAEAPVAEVAEFLNGLRTVKHKGKPLAPSTIAGYKSAIATIHRGFPDGTTVSSNTDLSTLIKGLFVVSARPRTLNETWDLPTVLKYLAGPPFEPIHTAPLRSVAVKTAFLLQLASARRGSWVHSCRIDACHLRWENGGVRLLPSLLLDKNQSVSFTPSEVFLLSLKEFSPEDKVHCPVRALKWYLELTKPLRGDEKALFIRSREPYTKATKSTVAGWVKEAIAGAFSHLPKERRQRMGIRAHDTRGVATTWATMAGVPFEAIMDAAAWSRPQTFAQFYLKDLPATKGRFSRAVLVTAGTASRK